MWMEPLDQAASVLYMLGGLIAGGFAALILLRIRGERSAEHMRRSLEKHQDYFNYLSANMDSAEPLLPPPGAIEPMELKAIQSKLLEWIETIDGVHRATLTALCRDLGLVELELQRLRSFRHGVRIDAAYHLGGMRAGEAAPELLKLLKQEGAESTAFVVGRAAAKCARETAELRRIVTLLTRHHPHAGQLIADIVASSSLDPVPLYTELLSDTTDAALLTVALIGMSGRTEPGVFPLLDRLILSELKEVRIKAAKIMLQYPHLLPLERIGELLHHPDWEIRAAAVKAAGEQRIEFFISALQQALSDEHWWVRYYSARSLAQLGPEAFEALCQTACGAESDPSREAAWHAVHEEMDRAAASASQETKQLPYYSRLNYIYRKIFTNNKTSHTLNRARISS